jgi:membrane protease YdiL (CAAX protease family)
LSASNNPSEGPLGPPTEGVLAAPTLGGDHTVTPDIAAVSATAEDPPWGLVEVVGLTVFTILAMSAVLVAFSMSVQRYRAPKLSWLDIARWPEVVVPAMVVAYGLVLAVMYRIASSGSEGAFRAIKWNWPRNWPVFLGYGVLLSITLQLLAHLLPMPKTLPIDEFFRTPREAWLLSIFGITVAPLLEELFFRGFFYPALARRFGVAASVLVTGMAFGAIHGTQLKYSWGPVLIIVIVGIVLSAVRAAGKSVASTFLMHAGYNLTLMVALFASTDGFRHLDKLSR